MPLVALRVPSKRCSAFLKTLSKSLLNYPRMKNIVEDAGSRDRSTKLLLLNEQIKELSALPEPMSQFVAEEGAEAVPYKYCSRLCRRVSRSHHPSRPLGTLPT